MPGALDGIDLAHYVRERYPHMIIVVSSSIPSHLLKELPDGVPFLQKPYFDKSLVDGRQGGQGLKCVCPQAAGS